MLKPEQPNHKMMVKGELVPPICRNVGGDQKPKKGRRGLKTPKRRLSLVFAVRWKGKAKNVF